MNVSKAPIIQSINFHHLDNTEKAIADLQVDSCHIYYTTGPGGKEIHKEEVKGFVKWLKEHSPGTLHVGDELRLTIPLKEVESLLKEGEDK